MPDVPSVMAARGAKSGCSSFDANCNRSVFGLKSWARAQAHADFGRFVLPEQRLRSREASVPRENAFPLGVRIAPVLLHSVLKDVCVKKLRWSRAGSSCALDTVRVTLLPATSDRAPTWKQAPGGHGSLPKTACADCLSMGKVQSPRTRQQAARRKLYRPQPPNIPHAIKRFHASLSSGVA